jgi:uroporphyrinogen-III synthase
LRAAGADVTIAPAYRTVIPESSIPAIREMFSRPENYPDAVTFTSSSTAHNLLALLEAAGLTLPSEILRVSIGPITSQTLSQLGFPPHIEAKEPSVVSLAAAIVERLS